MNKRVSVAEAKREFTKLLREAEEKGQGIIVTRRGVPFMVILRYENYERLEQLRGYFEALRLSKKFADLGIHVDELVRESRKELEERGAGE